MKFDMDKIELYLSSRIKSFTYIKYKNVGYVRWGLHTWREWLLPELPSDFKQPNEINILLRQDIINHFLNWYNKKMIKYYEKTPGTYLAITDKDVYIWTWCGVWSFLLNIANVDDVHIDKLKQLSELDMLIYNLSELK